MNMVHNTTQAIEKEVVRIINSLTKVPRTRLRQVRDLSRLGFDMLDVVNIILEVEKRFKLTIPDEVPVYSLDDVVCYVHRHSGQQAS